MTTLFFMMIICSFIWAGFIGAISFMESWLKFRAPGLTINVGLNIGKLVFSALNRVEWAFAIFICIGIVLNSSQLTFSNIRWFVIIILILILQTVWLLPALNARANALINGKTLPPSGNHWYFVIAEFVKLIILILFGISLIKSMVLF
jgi:hypothetical protein